MATINIGAANAGDEFYRYKMPKLVAKVSGALTGGWGSRATEPPREHAHPPQIEGRGNGIKTNVVNNVDIAKALERPPECASGTRCAVLAAPWWAPRPLPTPATTRPRRRAEVLRVRAWSTDEL